MFSNVKQAFPIFFCYKDPIPKELISDVIYKFQCGLCNESYYGESMRHLDIKSGEHIGVSPHTGKKVKPSNNSAVYGHLLHCNFYLLLATSVV